MSNIVEETKEFGSRIGSNWIVDVTTVMYKDVDKVKPRIYVVGFDNAGRWCWMPVKQFPTGDLDTMMQEAKILAEYYGVPVSRKEF